MVEWVAAKRRYKRQYQVYYLIFSDASTYVGYTSKHIFKRWLTHSGNKTHTLVNEKYKKLSNPTIVILAKFDDIQLALEYEKRCIRKLGPTLNISKGGEKGPIGVKRRYR